MYKKYSILVIIVILIASIYPLISVYQYMYAGAVKEDTVLIVPSGSDKQKLLDLIKSSDELKNYNLFQAFADQKLPDNKNYGGRYTLKKGMSYRRLVNMFAAGLQTPVNVTFNNIRTLDNLAGRVSKYLESDSTQFSAYFKNEENARKYGYNSETFVSMFIPNTYQMFWTTTPELFVEKMNKESEKFWNGKRDSLLLGISLTKNEAMTLASIVYEETKKEDEMARVAGVYINRLRIGMPLQADPTVKFAVGDFSIKRVLNKHLSVDSPYNTYTHQGLPPGPISMPSIAAIDAVLNFEQHNYLYFCAKEDFSGYHRFATTLSEHSRNAQLYVKELNRLGVK